MITIHPKNKPRPGNMTVDSSAETPANGTAQAESSAARAVPEKSPGKQGIPGWKGF
jgi:hypothetical protein